MCQLVRASEFEPGLNRLMRTGKLGSESPSTHQLTSLHTWCNFVGKTCYWSLTPVDNCESTIVLNSQACERLHEEQNVSPILMGTPQNLQFEPELLTFPRIGAGSDNSRVVIAGAALLVGEDKQTRKPVTARKPPANSKASPLNGCVTAIGIRLPTRSSKTCEVIVAKRRKKRRKPT